MKVLIVDDEAPARTRLARLFADMPGYEVVGEAQNGVEALHMIDELQPDIVLLDIRMPNMTGLEVAQHLTALSNPPAVVFATAYDEYALAAFETQAVDYLLKPVRKERLLVALDKAQKVTRVQLEAINQNYSPDAQNAEPQRQPLQRTHFWVRLAGEVQLIPVSEVLYLHADAKYVTLVYQNGETLIDESLKKIEAEFGDRFLRIHRATLVSVDKVTKMTRDKDGRVYVEVDGSDQQLEVSRRMMSAVRRTLREYASRARKR